nr:hypothetical protein [Kitasatospora sp. MBT63]
MTANEELSLHFTPGKAASFANLVCGHITREIVGLMNAISIPAVKHREKPSNSLNTVNLSSYPSPIPATNYKHGGGVSRFSRPKVPLKCLHVPIDSREFIAQQGTCFGQTLSGRESQKIHILL